MVDSSTAARAWHALLRERGYRLTPQRELVLAAVDRLGHATPEEIHEEVSQKSSAVNISTVYRTLALLDELDLVRQVYVEDRTPIYHTKRVPDHVHLTCSDCGRVIDADPAEFAGLSAELERRHGFAVEFGRVALSGRCADCRRRAVP